MTVDHDSRQPFAQTLRELMAQRDVSVRTLAKQTAGVRSMTAEPYSTGAIQAMRDGTARPTVESMEVIARALGVDPRVFLEYRQHVAAQAAATRERELGLDAVLAALEQASRQRA